MKIVVKDKKTGLKLLSCDLWLLVVSRLFRENFYYTFLGDLKVEVDGVNVPMLKDIT